MPSVGQVVEALTANRLNKTGRGKKYHFCICATNRLYLFVCSDKFPHDFPITKQECPGLPEPVSYISLSRKIFASDDTLRKGGAKLSCVVGDEFMKRFCDHIRNTPVLSDRDRIIILNGISCRC